MFGKENLKNIIQGYADKTSIEIVEAIIDAIRNFRSSKNQEDDITLVVIKVEE